MTLSGELLQLISPLALALNTRQQTAALLYDLKIVAHPAHVGDIPESIEALGITATDAINALATIDDASLSAAERTIQALEAINGIFDAIEGLEAIAAQGVDSFAEPFDQLDTWLALAHRLPAYMLRQWLRHDHPIARALLRIAGILQATGEGGETLDFDAIQQFIDDPMGKISTSFADNSLDLWEPLQDFVAALGGSLPDVIGGGYQGDEFLTTPERSPLSALGFKTMIVSRRSEQDWALAIDTIPSLDQEGGIQFLLSPSTSLSDPLPLDSSWSISGAIGNVGPVGLTLAPHGVRPAPSNTEDTVKLAITGAPAAPWLLIGSDGTTRLELSGVTFELDAQNLLASAPNVVMSLLTDGLRFVLTMEDGDAFLAGAFGGGEVSADMSFSVSWSSTSGFAFGGTAGFETVVPLAQSFGPVELETLRITVDAEESAVSSTLAASLRFILGPVNVVVEDVGLDTRILAAAQSGKGAFGDLDFTIAFKPPTGLGLSVNADVVTGGGFLSFDRDAGRYTGAAALSILDASISAIGIVETKLPNNGWSMFLSLFLGLPSIQLGFGFTLNGVGGLVGIHRGLDEDALGDAVRSGALDDILFPDDPIANATRILSEIEAVFPTVEDQYVFGPVVKIGWGTPTLVELDVGVAIQLPEPLTISLLGALSAILPDENAPILVLKVAFAGTANITEGTLKIDASLTGSEVAGFLITGDMSVRMEFLGQPSFLVAFGGFHPGFDPPSSFPRLERLGISLDTGDILQITLGSYFALSSNSIQFGAFAHLYISEVGFTAEGGASFDALIIYRPFGFAIGVSAWVSVSVANKELLSVLLEGNLTGPNPWHVVATTSFKLLGLKQNINLDLTFGDSEGQAASGQIDVQALIVEELERDDAWSIVSPAEGSIPVITSTDDAALDPGGRVQISQRIAPLDRTIERYGDAALIGADSFSIQVLNMKGDEIEDVEDWFGSEHYYRLDQDERLSAPSFTPMKAGVSVGRAETTAPARRTLTYDHEVVYRDEAAETPKRQFSLTASSALDRALGERGSVSSRQSFSVSQATHSIVGAETGLIEAETTSSDFLAQRQGLAAAGLGQSVVVPDYELELLA